MRTLIRLFIILSITLCTSLWQSFSAINFGITPIKYELNLAPWESITLPMSIRNNSSTGVTMPTTTSDFTSNGTWWAPSFIRKSELVYPDQQLSTWITINDSSVTAAPWELVTTNFTINVPTTATPGGHYGAVFFKKQSGAISGGWDIWIDVDYGIIILVNVSWEVVVEVEIEEPTISTWWWWGGYTWSGDQWLFEDGLFSYAPNNNAWYVWTDEAGQTVYQNQDSCPFWDFTLSQYDGKCFWNPFQDIDNQVTDNTTDTDSSDITDPENAGKNNDFKIDFSIPINNTGNTHIKPSWKITLRDENGEIIKSVWKESIVNDDGVVLWQDIVDYLPINDQGWNVLPSSQRIFESEWKWFPYKSYDDQGNQIMSYWSPSEYYTQQNKDEAGFLMLWQRVSESRKHKIITAEIELIYYDENWEPVEFSTAQEFSVQYIEEEITTNPYIILALLLLSTGWIFFWFGIKWWFLIIKNKKCWSCREKIKSHWGTCPHCSAIQNKKKHKAYERQREKEVIKAVTTKKTAPKKKIVKKPITKKTTIKKAPTKKAVSKK